MTTLRTVIQAPNKHNVDLTGGGIMTHLDRRRVDIDNPHEADLIAMGHLTVTADLTDAPVFLPSPTMLPGVTP